VCGWKKPTTFKKNYDFIWSIQKVFVYLHHETTKSIMGTYETELGYIVKETIEGLDVYQDGQIVCNLDGKCLNDYRVEVGDEDTDIDDDLLEADIKEEIEVVEFLDNMHGMY
jgi:hypothetical protein